MIRLLVDGVFFQLNNTGIARVWHEILKILVADRRFKVYFLDRGKAPIITGVEYIPFPSYKVENCPADSIMIQAVCENYGIDVFTSSYYTSPINVPMLLMVYDMIPELFGFDLNHRVWMEKAVAISFAQRYVCISKSTRRDLLSLYPEICEERATVEYCGVDPNIFRPRAEVDISEFRATHGLDRPYVLFVGSRVQHKGYKNSRIFFDALKILPSGEFDVFCVGGELLIEQSILEALPSGVRCWRADLTDDELANAYGGAVALVYPSLYEGFGMPVIEAMASGCPVITTFHGSLAEAAGDAALFVDGLCVEDMAANLLRAFNADVRADLRVKGLAHAKQFRWDNLANRLANDLADLLAESRTGMYDEFFVEWKRLRQMQANVDYSG